MIIQLCMQDIAKIVWESINYPLQLHNVQAWMNLFYSKSALIIQNYSMMKNQKLLNGDLPM